MSEHEKTNDNVENFFTVGGSSKVVQRTGEREAPVGTRRNLIEFEKSNVPDKYREVLGSFKEAIINNCPDTLMNIAIFVRTDDDHRDVFVFRMHDRMGSATVEFTAAPDESPDSIGQRAYKQIPRMIHTTGA